MSEENSLEVTPPEEIPPIPQISETATEVASTETPPEDQLAEIPSETPPRNRPRWVAPAWFFLGIIVGIAGFAAYNALIVKPSTPATAAQAESIDSTAAMRSAARDGVLEAISTLQAGGGQQQPAAQEPQGPQEVASNAFTVRDSNRQGNANAKVTIYEFSDFQ